VRGRRSLARLERRAAVVVRRWWCCGTAELARQRGSDEEVRSL